MGEAMYINANLYNEVITCDICNKTKKELTKFIKHKAKCTGREPVKKWYHIFKDIDDEDTTIYVCQSCVSRAFRKFDSRI